MSKFLPYDATGLEDIISDFGFDAIKDAKIFLGKTSPDTEGIRWKFTEPKHLYPIFGNLVIQVVWDSSDKITEIWLADKTFYEMTVAEGSPDESLKVYDDAVKKLVEDAEPKKSTPSTDDGVLLITPTERVELAKAVTKAYSAIADVVRLARLDVYLDDDNSTLHAEIPSYDPKFPTHCGLCLGKNNCEGDIEYKFHPENEDETCADNMDGIDEKTITKTVTRTTATSSKYDNAKRKIVAVGKRTTKTKLVNK